MKAPWLRNSWKDKESETDRDGLVPVRIHVRQRDGSTRMERVLEQAAMKRHPASRQREARTARSLRRRARRGPEGSRSRDRGRGPRTRRLRSRHSARASGDRPGPTAGGSARTGRNRGSNDRPSCCWRARLPTPERDACLHHVAWHGVAVDRTGTVLERCESGHATVLCRRSRRTRRATYDRWRSASAERRRTVRVPVEGNAAAGGT